MVKDTGLIAIAGADEAQDDLDLPSVDFAAT